MYILPLQGNSLAYRCSMSPLFACVDSNAVKPTTNSVRGDRLLIQETQKSLSSLTPSGLLSLPVNPGAWIYFGRQIEPRKIEPCIHFKAFCIILLHEAHYDPPFGNGEYSSSGNGGDVCNS